MIEESEDLIKHAEGLEGIELEAFYVAAQGLAATGALQHGYDSLGMLARAVIEESTPEEIELLASGGMDTDE